MVDPDFSDYKSFTPATRYVHG
eukprot:COSAG03_NODE_26174_length_261_cov_0.518519_1_plen_21_part_10